MRSRLVHAAYGVLATLLGVAAAHLVAALTDPASSPVLAVGSTVIDLTPTPVKEWAVARFGTSDKPILIGSVFAGVLVLSAVAGMLARRRFLLGAGMLVGLVALAGAAALSRPTAGLSDVLPAVVAGVVGGRRAGAGWSGSPGLVTGVTALLDQRRRPPTRRAVLISAGVMAAAAVAMGVAGRQIARARGVIKDLTLPAAAEPAPAFPEGLEGTYPGIAPLRTPNADFYRIDTRLTLPVIDRDTWTLTIDGDVDQEISLSFDDLLEMPLIERDITLTCVSNEVGGPYVGGTRWTGVRLTDLLDRAGIGSTGADQILSTDVDGMTISTPLDLATDGRDAMIAIAMDGQPLPRDHGYPARMVVPGLYGYVSACKWITRMTLTTYDEKTAYWTDRGWATDAPIKLMSRIDTPSPLSQRQGRQDLHRRRRLAPAPRPHRACRCASTAASGRTPSSARTPATTTGVSGTSTGTPRPGQHTLAVRALDENGEPQSAARATPFPDGASGVQSIVVNVA